MVDRASKFTRLRKAPNGTSRAVSLAICTALKSRKLPTLTLTADNGAEFAGHAYISQKLEAQFYFAKPYHAWQRGLNEHTNGLIRQFIPKRTDLDTISDARLRKIENRLNSRPRKVLGFQTPKEVLKQMTLNEQDGALGM